MPIVPPPHRFPGVGDEYLGFELLSELGRGTMGRVYLCRQLDLGGRLVVLKVGSGLSAESEKLARLDHPNIVPVHSFHRDGELHALCMPYRGPLTLARVIAQLRAENLLTMTGRALSTVISQCRQYQDPGLDSVPAADPEFTTLRPVPATDAGLPGEAVPARPFERLTGLSYVDAVVAISRDLAAGLAFAHSQSIVHSDLKPANVLIADDGRPLLLDFSIAYDRAARTQAGLRLGGTRPYMSPEQIRAFRAQRPEFDERSDLYALGVILYELLTGRCPFESTTDTSPGALERDLASRFDPPPPVRALNPKVPAGVESIIRKCLAPNAADRYQKADHLHEDLTRQLARRPLRFAPNPSARELAGKWVRRNRWVVAGLLALAIAGAAGGGFAAHGARQAEEVARFEALGAAESFAADAREAEFALGQASDPVLRDHGRQIARQALDRYHAGDDDRWFDHPRMNRLPPETRESIRAAVSGLMLLLAESHARQAARLPGGPARDEQLRFAGEWNRRAGHCHPDPENSRSVWAQRAYLARLAGDRTEADRLAARSAAVPRASAHDGVLEARQLMAEGRYHTARRLLKEATGRDPQGFWGWFYLGYCCDALGEYREAAAAYDIAATHQPGFYGTYYNRGLVRVWLRDAAGAEADFDRALAARPDWAEAYFNRAVARERGGRYREALADLDRAGELGYPGTSMSLVRSRVYDKLKDKVAAATHLAAAMKADPTDKRGWLARGQARMNTDPAGAQADFAQALRLDPDCRPALQATAHVLSRQGKNREAADALTRLIELSPDAPDAWSGRAVLYARLGDRDAALADAREALRLSDHPRTLYQAAGVYALTSRTHPDDRPEALALLSAALRAGFGFEHVDADKELDPLRGDPEFKKTVDAARAHRDARKKPD